MDTILGQDRALGVIRDALRSGRLHHAWIFAGPRGVGKCTTAVEIAKILLDPQAAPDLQGQLQSDPEGRVSRMIDAGSHPDLHLITKEMALYSSNAALRARKLMNIPLDLLRERMLGGRTADDKYHEAAAWRTPVEGHGKVFIIDEAELIDATGQNALLKTLEEPPPATYIFLITSRPERLLPTILSRCQQVRFGALDQATLRAWRQRAELGVPEADAQWIESFCDGSPGTALLAAEYGFHDWQRRLDPMLETLERGRFPAELGPLLAELVGEFSDAWVKRHDNASKDAANKSGAREVLRLLSAHARRRLHETSRQGAAGPWPEVIDVLARAERHLDANVNMKQALENLVAQWTGVVHRAAAGV